MKRSITAALAVLGLLAVVPAANAAVPQVTVTSSDAPSTWNLYPRFHLVVHDDDGDIGALSSDCLIDGARDDCGLFLDDTDSTHQTLGSYFRSGPFAPGAPTLTVRGTAPPGHFTDASLNWTTFVDSVAPVLTSFGPFSTQGKDTAILGWQIEDDHWGNVRATCTIDGAATDAYCESYPDGGVLHRVPPGSHTVEVYYDDTQNSAVATTTIVMPGTPPPTPTPTPPPVAPPVTPTPVTPPAPGNFTAPKRAKADRKGHVAVRLTCAVPQGCAKAAFKLVGAHKRVVAKLTVPAGKSRTVTAKAPRRATLKLVRL